LTTKKLKKKNFNGYNANINFGFHEIYKYNKIYIFFFYILDFMFKNFNIILNSKLFLKCGGNNAAL